MKVYVSKSNKANPTLVQLVKQLLSKQGHEIIEWNGGPYNPKMITEAKAMVVVSEFLNGIVGKGQHSEINIAFDIKIPVYGLVKIEEITIHDDNDAIIAKLIVGKITSMNLLDEQDYRNTAKFIGEKGTAVKLKDFVLE